MDPHWLAAQNRAAMGGLSGTIPSPGMQPPIPSMAGDMGADLSGRAMAGASQGMPGSYSGMPAGMTVMQAAAMHSALMMHASAMGGGFAPPGGDPMAMHMHAAAMAPGGAGAGPDPAMLSAARAGHPGPMAYVSPQRPLATAGVLGGPQVVKSHMEEPSVGDGSHSDLVRQIKMLQREDPTARQLWWQWCEARGNNVRDPGRHGSPFLRQFMEAKGNGSISLLSPDALPPPRGGGRGKGGRGKGGGGGDPTGGFGGGKGCGGGPQDVGAPKGGAHAQLVARVKEGQRSSPEWKRRWWRHCDAYGGGVRDPNRHEAAFIRQFLEGVSPEGGAPDAPAAVPGLALVGGPGGP